jgi:hypothetical protein
MDAVALHQAVITQLVKRSSPFYRTPKIPYLVYFGSPMDPEAV